MKERELWNDPEDDDSAIHLMALRGGRRAGKKIRSEKLFKGKKRLHAFHPSTRTKRKKM
jgi:hypothetical protein